MGVVVAPIVDGKLDVWKAWIAELNGPRVQELKEFNQRYGLTRHAAWLAETPMGPIVVAMHEGPGGDEFMAKIGSSDNDFDKVFVAKVKEIHGLDVTQPPPGPMPVNYLDARA
ncbi:MAG: hypothetical protein O2812_02710 [Chloroflexi bacterium]|nr:hypothetical protein [Chloroflexota bacterium]